MPIVKTVTGSGSNTVTRYTNTSTGKVTGYNPGGTITSAPSSSTSAPSSSSTPTKSNLYSTSTGSVSSATALKTAQQTGVGIVYTNDQAQINEQYQRQQLIAKGIDPTGMSATQMSQTLNRTGGSNATMPFTPDYNQLKITSGGGSSNVPTPYVKGATIYQAGATGGAQLSPTVANAAVFAAQEQQRTLEADASKKATILDKQALQEPSKSFAQITNEQLSGTVPRITITETPVSDTETKLDFFIKPNEYLTKQEVTTLQKTQPTIITTQPFTTTPSALFSPIYQPTSSTTLKQTISPTQVQDVFVRREEEIKQYETDQKRAAVMAVGAGVGTAVTVTAGTLLLPAALAGGVVGLTTLALAGSVAGTYATKEAEQFILLNKEDRKLAATTDVKNILYDARTSAYNDLSGVGGFFTKNIPFADYGTGVINKEGDIAYNLALQKGYNKKDAIRIKNIVITKESTATSANLVGLLNAGAVSEATGTLKIGSQIYKSVKTTKQEFWPAIKTVLKTSGYGLAEAGAQEGGVSYLVTTTAREEKPTWSGLGLSTIGGAGSALFLGTLPIVGQTLRNAPGVKAAAGRISGKVSNWIGNVLDVTEHPSDIISDISYGKFIKNKPNIRINSGAFSLTSGSDTFVSSITTTNVPSQLSIITGTPSNIIGFNTNSNTLFGGKTSTPGNVLGFGGKTSTPGNVLGFGGKTSTPSNVLGFGGKTSTPSNVLGFGGKTSTPINTFANVLSNTNVNTNTRVNTHINVNTNVKIPSNVNTNVKIPSNVNTNVNTNIRVPSLINTNTNTNVNTNTNIPVNVNVFNAKIPIIPIPLGGGSGGGSGSGGGKQKTRYTASLRAILGGIKRKGAAKSYLSGAMTGQELRAINI